MLCCAVLCCAVLCCAVLCCTVLYCTVLCCAAAVLYCAVLYCAVLCCAVLYCAMLCCLYFHSSFFSRVRSLSTLISSQNTGVVLSLLHPIHAVLSLHSPSLSLPYINSLLHFPFSSIEQQMLLSHDAMEINHAPNPNDIIWENVSIPKSQVRTHLLTRIASLTQSVTQSVRFSLLSFLLSLLSSLSFLPRL